MLGPWEDYQNTPPEVREARLLAAAAFVSTTNTVDD